MNKFFLTLDLEEWYHLDYLRTYPLDKSQNIIPLINSFFNIVDELNIELTIFVLGEEIEKNKKLILDASNSGHEIAIHGWDHLLLTQKNNTIFRNCYPVGRAVEGYERGF